MLNVLDWIVPMAAVLVVFVVGDPVLCDSQTCRQRIGRIAETAFHRRSTRGKDCGGNHDHRAGDAQRQTVI